MTLRVVSDNTLVLNDIPAELRRLADEIESGEFGDISTIIAVIDSDGYLFTETLGRNPSRFEAVGMFELAKQETLNSDD